MILNVQVDKEKAKSMLEMAGVRKTFLKSTSNLNNFPTIIAENYYEIIKEMASAILLLEGKKAIGDSAHKDLINELRHHKEFDESEIKLMDDLRIKRNKSQYEGKQIEQTYIENKKEKIEKIITKLEKLIDKKL